MYFGRNPESHSHSDYPWYWLKLNDNTEFWEVSLTSAAFGDEAFDIQAKSATFDTGASFIYVPPHDFETLQQVINRDNQNECETLSGILYCNRNIFHHTYKNFTIGLNDDVFITFQPRYFMEYDDEQAAWMIKYAAPKRNLDHWVFGAAFLQQFYQIYDLEERRVGIQTIQSENFDLVRNWNWLDMILSHFVLFVIVFSAVLLCGCSFLRFYCGRNQ